LGGDEFTAFDDHAGEVVGVAVAGGVKREGKGLGAVEFFVEDFEVGDFDAKERGCGSGFGRTRFADWRPAAARADVASVRGKGLGWE